MTDHGSTECIECGKVSERLLHPGFPHICSRCLFPPTDENDKSRYHAGNTPLTDVLMTRAQTVRARRLA